jgi:hypothetical protein
VGSFDQAFAFPCGSKKVSFPNGQSEPFLIHVCKHNMSKTMYLRNVANYQNYVAGGIFSCGERGMLCYFRWGNGGFWAAPRTWRWLAFWGFTCHRPFFAKAEKQWEWRRHRLATNCCSHCYRPPKTLPV